MKNTLRFNLMMLAAAGGVALCVLAAAAFVGSHQASKAVDRGFDAKDLVADILPPPMYLIELRLVLGMAVEGTLPVAEAQKEYQRLSTEYNQRVEYWTKHPPYGLEAQLLGAQHEAGKRLIAASGALLSAVAGNDREASIASLKTAHELYLAHRAGVDATVSMASKFATNTMDSYFQTTNRMLWLIGLVFAVTTGLLMTLSAWVQRSVMRTTGGEPAEAARIANAVAEGDLTIRVTVPHGDTTSVMAALDRMCTNLRTLVVKVSASSDSIASGSQQIAQGNHDLSQRTEVQASALEETAASMEQLGTTVKQNADNARRANQLSLNASSVAVQGGEVVGEVVQTMKGINDSSRRIAEIIGVIDGIAFQTNILALNAAVEAARAGEQGRGFAVVASEVRNLAQRSAGAAKEIKTLINASVEQVEQGTSLVDRAGSTMQEVVNSIRRVTDIMGEISTASNEQSAGVSQVGEAVSQMDQTTQQNAALVEESAAAATSLNSQAQQLVQAVALFKLT